MKMQMKVEHFRAHVDEMAHHFQIHVVYTHTKREEAKAVVLRDSRPGSQKLQKLVFARPIDDETGYAVVMHELGHHVAPNGFCRIEQPDALETEGDFRFYERWLEYFQAKLVAEEAAWEWARYYIEQRGFYWTAAMEQTKEFALDTYRIDKWRRRR